MTQIQPSVAIVILNYNGQKFLEKFLPSVIQSTYHNKKIIIADNASIDSSIGWLRTKYPEIEILLNANNDGFAGGYNWALQQVISDYYVLLNSDVEVTPNWIEPIIELMESDKTIAACQPKILAYHQKTHFEYAGACGGFIDAFGYPFSRGRIFDVCEKDENQYNTAEKVFWATGAALFIKSNAFHEMGGFDASFFAHMEEIDLCWRLQLAGYQIYVQPRSIVYHVGGGTLPKGYRKTYLNFRNNLIMLFKNLPLSQKIIKIPFRFLLDYITALKALLSRDWDMLKAILTAHKDAFKWRLQGKIKKTQNRVGMSKLNGCYNGSIVWQYFVKKVHTFKDLQQ